VLNLIYQLVSTIGLWAGTVYVPTAIIYLARTGYTGSEASRLASYGTAILSIGTIVGALIVPAIANRFGRRVNQAIFYVLMMVAILVTFGYVFYLPANALKWFMLCLFFLGLGGANYTAYSFWMPEQYDTQCRASALAFAQNIGRFVGAGATFLVGVGVSHYQTLGFPVAMTAFAFVIGLVLLPFGTETKSQPLPS
jgi:MFS family permease